MRETTPIDAIAEGYVDALVQYSPMAATSLGIPGHDHLMDDFSPAARAGWAQVERETLAELQAATPRDDTDRVTVAAMQDRLGLSVESFEAGDHKAELNNIASPLQSLHEIFDLMPTDTPDHWAAVSSRMSGIPAAIDGYIETLREGIRDGIVPARRAVADGVTQASALADPATSRFHAIATSSGVEGSAGEDLAEAAGLASAAYQRLADFLADDLAPVAPESDAVGRDRYARASRKFIGARIDLDETYDWGVEALGHIAAEQEALARKIAGPGASIADAVRTLNADPATQIHGTAALQEWMQATSQHAMQELDRIHFDIPEPVKTLECRIAPSQTGAIYYTGPAEDWSRPGRMWWSVPEGVTEFNTWMEKTTVFHEGVPGHHLQIGQAVCNAAELNRWRRLVCWNSGHGEGWALYAERLMEEFGFLESMGDRFGMLDAQRLRATRVVVDLGVHLGKPAFDRYGGGVWDHDKAWALLRDNVQVEDNQLHFELNRYLSWPGQAPSYRVGQRIWEQIRRDAQRQATERGEAFSLKHFHTRALNLGSLPLDVLRKQLLG
ncbi:DUF885 domain-containing protein [Tessaracoccus antarcticus]|uniref:DUF885 domain-containing protein n=1 Tax=Tessaracoccus antarcticus TaxID=2479848 RepID=A0A3M0G4Q3_9ACTN|nr:DUF885 domain-containing protein [Tessaracoccus antarcticus]RMB59990.1 DUF885 domain-containing protein [Tessaracoccus antarcticus]